MTTRLQWLVDHLGLQPHPEGGYFCDAFRSPRKVQPLDERPERCALTAIYFLLPAGQRSRWHCVASDEIWCYLEGSPLELLCCDTSTARFTRKALGPLTDSETAPMQVIPAGAWQAAQSLGDYTLVACYVGPGFEYQDFRLAADDPRAAQQLEALTGRGQEFL